MVVVQITHFFPRRRNQLDKTAWETNNPSWRNKQHWCGTCLGFWGWNKRNCSICHILKAKGCCWYFSRSYCNPHRLISVHCFSQFTSNYSARLPATLILRNAVTSDQEFIYSIQVLSKHVKNAESIGHFRVPKNLTFKARLSAKPLIWKWFLIMMQIKLIFTTKVSHLASFWKWDLLELGNGLFTALKRKPVR